MLGPYASSARAAGPSPAQMPIGMNLATIADWARGFPFRNLMLGARIWGTRDVGPSSPWDTGLAHLIETDRDGYPIEIPVMVPGRSAPQIVFSILPNTLTPGTYVVLYDGEGAIGAGAGTTLLSSAPGRVVVSMRHSGGDPLEVITIRRSVRGNHIRNLRVLALEDETIDLATSPFQTDFLNFCRQFHCLRFMGWLQTNASINRRWEDRKRLSFYTQVGATGGAPVWQHKWASGVALEHCIDLCNAIGSDAWLCVPHLADDDYIAGMAKLTRDRLDPALRVCLEYSNELWNWGFQQAQWQLRSELAGHLVTKAGGSPPWKGSAPVFHDGVVVRGTAEGINHPERIGALFRRAFKIWEEVFAGERRKRLVRVCAVQAAWTDTVDSTLNWVMKNGGCDVLSPAGYFGPDEAIYRKWDGRGAALTADEVLADMRQVMSQVERQVATNATLARRAGVRFSTYEGGQHIQPEGQASKPYLPALRAAQYHPEMYDLYRRLLQIHRSNGCDLFCAYNSIGPQGTRFGSWGHVTRYDEKPADMPKYRALLDVNAHRSTKLK